MENRTVSAKLNAMKSYPLIVTFSNYPVWNVLVGMLRPLEIVSLARATIFCLKPSHREIRIYMKWWRQIFYNIKWAERNSNTPILGLNFWNLEFGLKYWLYSDPAQMSLLLIVKDTLPAGWEGDNEIRAMAATCDAPMMWSRNINQVQQSENVQVCMAFLQHLYVDLDRTWTRLLLNRIDPPGTHFFNGYEPPPGMRRVIWSTELDPWYSVCYLHSLGDLRSKMAYTSPELTIDFDQFFDVDRSVIRLTVREDGSVVIPAMPADLFSRSIRNDDGY